MGPGGDTIAPSPPGAVASYGSLLGEVRRELAAMRTTHYQHKTEVDEASGTFFYDCSGLLDYVLGRVLPPAASMRCSPATSWPGWPPRTPRPAIPATS